MFQKKIVKKAKRLVFTCFFKGLQMVELKKRQVSNNNKYYANNNYYTRSYLNIHTFTPLKRKSK